MEVSEHVIKFLKYCTSRANLEGYQGLTVIHLVKYLYLVDYFSIKFQNSSFTGWSWKMWDFGPWNYESQNSIKVAYDQGYLLSRKKVSKFNESNEYDSFYVEKDDLTPVELDRFGKELIPCIRTRLAVDNYIKKYGYKTNSLLAFVYYRTEPVYSANKGDCLDFSLASVVSGDKKIKKKNISRNKEKKLKIILEKIRARKKVSYDPPKGEFDEVYFQGIDELNEQDELKLSGDFEGTVSVDESRFKGL